MTDEPDECPYCSAELAANATRCRRCGASEEYGWNNVDGLGPEYGDGYREDEDDFDYDEFVAREFPEHADGRSTKNGASGTGPSMTARVIILALLVSLIMTFVFF